MRAEKNLFAIFVWVPHARSTHIFMTVQTLKSAATDEGHMKGSAAIILVVHRRIPNHPNSLGYSCQENRIRNDSPANTTGAY